MESAIRSAFVGIGVNGIQGGGNESVGNKRENGYFGNDFILHCYEIAGITDWILERRSHGKDSR